MPVQLNGATSGSVTLTVPATAGTNTLTVPAKTGNIITSADSGTVTQTMIQNGNSGAPLPGIGGTGPAFNATSNTNQSITTGVATKVTLSVEEFDTNNNFSSSRFTPTVAGYYNINGFTYTSATSQTYGYAMIYRNGSIYQGGIFFVPYGGSISTSVASVVMYLNGSSDFVELYVQSDGTSPSVVGSSPGFNARFSGALVRAA
jgi:hypothetical protein